MLMHLETKQIKPRPSTVGSRQGDVRVSRIGMDIFAKVIAGVGNGRIGL